MENLAHTLTGIVISRTGLHRKVPFGTTSFVIAANLADIDSVTAFKGSLQYLHYHRGFTHSLAGTLALTLMISLGLWLWNRRYGDRKFALGGIIVGLSAVFASHPLLDYTNSYGIWPLLPFSQLRIFGDLVFIVDPYFWVILGGAVFLTTDLTRVNRVVWLMGTGAVTLLLAWFSTVDSAAVWALLILTLSGSLLILCKARYSFSRTRVAVASLGLLVIYLGFLFVCRTQALSAAKEFAGRSLEPEAVSSLSVLPTPANPFRWEVLAEDAGSVYYTVFNDKPTAWIAYPKNSGEPAVQAALQTCPGRVLAGFGRFAFYEVRGRADGPDVVFRDGRYGRTGEGGFGTFRIPLTADLGRLRVPLSCP